MGEPKGVIVVPIGFGPSDDLRSLELDSADNLKVAFDAAAQGLVGPHGWISGAWQKNPVLLGYSGPAVPSIVNLSLPAGTSNQDSTPVPAGEVQVISALSVRVVSTSITTLIAIWMALGATVQVVLVRQVPPVSGTFYLLTGQWVMTEGDFFRCSLVGATLNDDLNFSAAGYRVDLDQ